MMSNKQMAQQDQLRYHLLFITCLLCMIGFVAIYAASSVYSQQIYGQSSFFLKKQVVVFVIGVLSSIVMLKQYA